MGDKELDIQDQAIDNMLKIGEHCEEMADQINMELDRQIQALDRVQENVYDQKKVLKRTNRQIRYFARSVATDKILLCLLISVTICVIVLISLSFLGLDNGKLNVYDIFDDD